MKETFYSKNFLSQPAELLYLRSVKGKFHQRLLKKVTQLLRSVTVSFQEYRLLQPIVLSFWILFHLL